MQCNLSRGTQSNHVVLCLFDANDVRRHAPKKRCLMANYQLFVPWQWIFSEGHVKRAPRPQQNRKFKQQQNIKAIFVAHVTIVFRNGNIERKEKQSNGSKRSTAAMIGVEQDQGLFSNNIKSTHTFTTSSTQFKPPRNCQCESQPITLFRKKGRKRNITTPFYRKSLSWKSIVSPLPLPFCTCARFSIALHVKKSCKNYTHHANVIASNDQRRSI